MMLRNGHRLCRALHRPWSTRWQFFSSAKYEQSVGYQHDHADMDVAKRDADDRTQGKISTDDRSSKVVVGRSKPLTREPFVKNLFLGKFDTVSYISPCHLSLI